MDFDSLGTQRALIPLSTYKLATPIVEAVATAGTLYLL
jgi:hypothetical protein